MGIINAIARKGADILDDAHVYGAERGAVSRRNMLFGAYASSVVTVMTTGVYLTGFCLALGADANYINTVVVFITVCSMAQIFAPILLDRVRKRRNLIISMLCAGNAINLVLIPVLVFAGVPDNVMLPLFTFLISVVTILGSLASPGIMAWHIGNISEEKRLGFFSFLMITSVVVSCLSPFLGGIIADRLAEVFGESVSLSLIRLAMVVFAALALFFFYRVDEPEYAENTEKFSPAGILRGVRAHPEYLSVILSIFMWSMSASIPGMYIYVLLLDDFEISYTFFNSVNLFYIILVIALTPVWKRIASKHKIHNTMFIAMFLFTFHVVGYLILSKKALFMFPVSEVYAQIFAVGINLCFTLAPYINLPTHNRTMFLSLYNTVAALAGIIGLFIGRIIFELSYGVELPFGIDRYRLILIVMAVLLIITAFVSRVGLREREA